MTIRTVLVTGTGRGISPAIAFRLAGSGWHVFGGTRIEVAAKELIAASDLSEPVTLDVTEPGQPAALDQYPPDRLDGLVHTAAVAVPGPIETLSQADMHRQSDVNLVGLLAFTPTVLPRLRRARGSVVLVSPINGGESFPFTGLDNTSQSAVEAAADCLRIGLRPFGVQVALIEPGVIDTDAWREMEQIPELEAGPDSEHRARHQPHVAAERQPITKICKKAKLPRTGDPRRGAPAHPAAVTTAHPRGFTRPRNPLPEDTAARRRLDALWRQGIQTP